MKADRIRGNLNYLKGMAEKKATKRPFSYKQPYLVGQDTLFKLLVACSQFALFWSVWGSLGPCSEKMDLFEDQGGW